MRPELENDATKRMNCVVVSPEYGEVIPVLDYGEGPVEYASDVCLVLGARTRKEAKWAAYQVFKQQGTPHFKNARADRKHPLTGLWIEPYPTEDEWPGEGAPDDYDETFDANVRSWRPFVADLRGEVVR